MNECLNGMNVKGWRFFTSVMKRFESSYHITQLWYFIHIFYGWNESFITIFAE